MAGERRGLEFIAAVSRHPMPLNGFLSSGLGSIMMRTTAINDGIARLLEPARRLHAIAQRSTRRQRMFEAAGWLPHYTTPFDDLDALEDEDAAGDLLDAHYRDRWEAVRRELESHLATYVIDDEARAVFREALACHEAKAYRAVSRLLFPEIERLATALFPDRRGKQGGPARGLREFASELYLDQTEPGGVEGFELFRRLDEHLYAPVHSEEEVERARRDAVPMRHAALHGKVSYASFRNSLNALIMMDYVLQVVSIRTLKTAEASPTPTMMNADRRERESAQTLPSIGAAP